jgi:hypothetical protein
MLTPDQKRALEALIDADDLRSVVETIADICGEKAEHIRSNWQDAATASVWDRAARRILRVTDNANVKAVSR